MMENRVPDWENLKGKIDQRYLKSREMATAGESKKGEGKMGK